MTFWDHLDELRGVIIRCMVVTLLLMVVAFVFKDQVFAVILHPKGDDLRLINTAVTGQFVTHMMVSFYVGLIGAMPYILYQLFNFVAPGLYRQERRLAIRLVVSGYVMFALGVLFSYFVIFPFTLQFLGGYQVSNEVSNLISLESYIDTLTMLSLMLGVLFEMPVVSWLLSSFGLLSADVMRRQRRPALLAIVVIAAVITPTSDAFTLMIVTIPVYLLYEVSILVARK
ncbi:MAG: twin-arginine translocase subunit TatC [Bacteroidaceae bacterium]|nr:twin-arginine translocase subunit TatC [Bacteroidaceae bacterium]